VQRTLFFVPHEIAGFPLWGWGWALIALVVAVALYLIVVWRKGGSISTELQTNGLWWLIAATVVVLVLPQIELRGVPIPPETEGTPVGLAVRGYGVMMLLGVASAIALAVYRGRARGVSAETILGLAPWLLIFGIIGARAFYVIEYHQHYTVSTASGAVDWRATLGQVFDFTSGGLVVYGSILGGVLGTILYAWRHQIRLLRLGDVIMPCLFLGIFFGRLGCLLNGCCYGGRCEDNSWALHFPKGSPVYDEQLQSGSLVGLELEVSGPASKTGLQLPAPITAVREGSLAAEAGLHPGQTVEALGWQPPPRDTIDPLRPAGDTRAWGVSMQIDGIRYGWPASQLPEVALPVRPAQIISSLSALGICLGLLALSPFCRRDGLLVVAGFAGYAVVRFGLEMIRNDEPGQFGTGLTISQLVSLVTFSGALVLLWVILRRQPQNFPPSGTEQPA